MTDDEFWALLREKQRHYPRPTVRQGYRWWPEVLRIAPCAQALRLFLIEYEAIWRSTDEVPIALKNELKYLDVDLNFHRDLSYSIQWFRIAEEEFNGVDEDELWWHPGRDDETMLPSERLAGNAR